MKFNKFIGVIIGLIIILICIIAVHDNGSMGFGKLIYADELNIIASNENRDLESIVKTFEKEKNIKVNIDYENTLDVLDKLKGNNDYDAVWLTNSMWFTLLDSSVRLSDAKITYINPVVFGIRKKKAKELDLVEKNVKLETILNAITSEKLRISLTNATQTNTGASSYLSFLNILAGNPSILKEEHLKSDSTKENLKKLYSSVNNTSGSDEYLKELYIENQTDAIVTYESDIIDINKKIKNDDDKIYAIYPIDGVAISDTKLAFLKEQNTDLEKTFLEFENYILDKDVQNKMIKLGKRTWYGGINKDAPKDIFNKEYGIDTSRYLYESKYPSKDIIKKALNLYQTELRKPVSIVFALDYSGSMAGDGEAQLEDAINYVLDSRRASEDFLQFTSKDKIGLLTFSDSVSSITLSDGENTKILLDTLERTRVGGTTNIFDAVTKATKYLENENTKEYNVSVVLMTDGEGNTGNEDLMYKTIKNSKIKIPVYSIMFASASEKQLDKIADASGGMVFDGTKDLSKAFKTVRGFN